MCNLVPPNKSIYLSILFVSQLQANEMKHSWVVQESLRSKSCSNLYILKFFAHCVSCLNQLCWLYFHKISVKPSCSFIIHISSEPQVTLLDLKCEVPQTTCHRMNHLNAKEKDMPAYVSVGKCKKSLVIQHLRSLICENVNWL